MVLHPRIELRRKQFLQALICGYGLVVVYGGLVPDDHIPVSYTHLDVYKRQLEEKGVDVILQLGVESMVIGARVIDIVFNASVRCV